MRIFQETQRFTQWWLQIMNLAMLSFTIYLVYKWFVLNESFSNVSAENRPEQIFVITLMLLLLFLIYLLRLKTTIDETGLHYQFIPINRSKKTVRWAELKKCYVRTYKPIQEYGGWGYRMSFEKGKALNVKGNKGIQLEFNNGKKLLIGTQKEENTQQVIERYFKTKDE